MAAMAFLVELLLAVEQAGLLEVDVDLALQAAASAAHGLVALRTSWPQAPWRQDLSETMREAMIAALLVQPSAPLAADP
jgi:hypothetical protein